MLRSAREKSFAQRIGAAQKKLRLSQAETARLWGFSQPLLSMWQHGVRHPTGLYREKLERILKRIGA